MMPRALQTTSAFLSLGLSAFVAASSHAQQTQMKTPAGAEVSVSSRAYWPRTQFTLRVDAKLVEVGVVVRDSRGRTVGGLNRDDFEIRDGGKKREIQTFSVESSSRVAKAAPSEQPAVTVAPPRQPAPVKAPPRYVALLLDDLSLDFPDLVHVRTAARRFLSEGMSAGDQLGVFTTSGRQVLPFTGDAPKIIATIDGFKSVPTIVNSAACPHLSPYDAYVIANKLDSTALAVKADELARCTGIPNRPGNQVDRSTQLIVDSRAAAQVQSQAEAMWAQIEDLSRASLRTIQDIVQFLGGMPGRRMILLASSGFLTQTLELEQEVIARQALRRQVVINSLDAKGVYTLDQADSTMGANIRSFIYQNSAGTRQKNLSNHVLANLALSTGGLFFHNNNDLNLGFREVGLMPDVSYVLGFAPEGPADGKYHKLKVGVKSKGTTVQARPGYWAISDPEANPLNVQRPADRKITSTDTIEELPARVSEVRAITENAEPALDIVLHIDVGRLHLEKTGDFHAQKLTWIAALFDAEGNFIIGKEIGVELALKEATFDRMSANGLNITVTLKAPPGSYKLRSVIVDSLQTKLAASTQAVQIR